MKEIRRHRRKVPKESALREKLENKYYIILSDDDKNAGANIYQKTYGNLIYK